MPTCSVARATRHVFVLSVIFFFGLVFLSGSAQSQALQNDTIPTWPIDSCQGAAAIQFILFPPKTATIDHPIILQRLVEAAQQWKNDGGVVLLTGYVALDEAGDRSSHLRLERAEYVRESLVSLGVPASNIWIGHPDLRAGAVPSLAGPTQMERRVEINVVRAGRACEKGIRTQRAEWVTNHCLKNALESITLAHCRNVLEQLTR